MQKNYSLAVDIGGTFTDVVLQRGDGKIWVEKTLTTPHDLPVGFFNGVDRVLNFAEIAPRDVNNTIVHATTVVTNALIERRGAKTAFITTKGFKDVLLIRDEWRYDMFDLQLRYPAPVVDPALCFTVDERTLADGERITPVDESEVRAIAEELRDNRVEAVAVCLFNAFIDSSHERDVRRILLTYLPDLFVSISSEVAPQIREYLRASTTSINAYVGPVVQPYLNRLSTSLLERGFQSRPLIMLSNGGVAGAGVAGSFPVRMIESGPAAGALAASYYATKLGLDRLLSFDMGGTTAKACLIEDGHPNISGAFEVDRVYRFKVGSGLPVTVPSIDLVEIGAGGGSIAWVDALGLLKVGPESAGAMPGPACYGRGGKSATVTDADLLLGFLDADSFLGGDMRLDRDGAVEQLTALGQKLGRSAEEAAASVFEVVCHNMALSARAHATDRGADVRGIPMFAFGGAGPVHACRVAELLESSLIIFPPQASVLSAVGTLVSPPRLDLVCSMVARIDQLDWDAVERQIGEMVAHAMSALAEAGCRKNDITLKIAADLRYQGQQYELTTDLDEDPRPARDYQAIRSKFERSYKLTYGVELPDIPVEVVNWRLIASGAHADLIDRPIAGTAQVKPKGARKMVLSDDPVHVWDRYSLPIAQLIQGPALIEERETTTVLLAGWRAEIDSTGSIVATRG